MRTQKKKDFPCSVSEFPIPSNSLPSNTSVYKYGTKKDLGFHSIFLYTKPRIISVANIQKDISCSVQSNINNAVLYSAKVSEVSVEAKKDFGFHPIPLYRKPRMIIRCKYPEVPRCQRSASRL